jgi:hypothetical protein
MNLGEQLAELRFNVLRDRSDLIAGDTDSLWSDETLLRYIGDAERRFARRSLILRDATTPEVTQLTLRQGVQTYPLHRSLLAVISARYWSPGGAPGTGYDLQRSGHALITQAAPLEALNWDPADPYSSQLPPGAPLAYYTDETLVYNRAARMTLSVYPLPDVTQDGTLLYLRTIRLPLSGYRNIETDLARESELNEDYQLDVLEWAAYRAQRTFDGDAGAPTLAEQHKQAFLDALTQATREAKRKMFAETTLRYGANGFSWER